MHVHSQVANQGTKKHTYIIHKQAQKHNTRFLVWEPVASGPVLEGCETKKPSEENSKALMWKRQLQRINKTQETWRKRVQK